MVRYNKVKLDTLEIIEEKGEATAHLVAILTNRRYEAASVALLKYYRHGLLHRRKLEGEKTYAYSLSERGLERLVWLQGELA